MVINEYCKDCQIRRNLNKYPATASADEIAEYQRGVRDIIAHCDGLSTPQISEKMIELPPPGPAQNLNAKPPFRVKNQRSGIVVDLSTSGPFSPESI